MSHLNPRSPITAILYSEGRDVDPVMARLASRLAESGVRIAGFVQCNLPRADRRRCDMALQEISSGEIIGISQDRGPLARGCHLNVSELLRGMQLGREALAQRPDLLLINKFGKTEGEGGGFRPLIAEAIELGVPVLIAVPWRNIDSWRAFSGELSTEVAIDDLVASPLGIDPAQRNFELVRLDSAHSVGTAGAEGMGAKVPRHQRHAKIDDDIDLLGLMIVASQLSDPAVACGLEISEITVDNPRGAKSMRSRNA
jgi:nucleoside-triphosphatase THEP1